MTRLTISFSRIFKLLPQVLLLQLAADQQYILAFGGMIAPLFGPRKRIRHGRSHFPSTRIDVEESKSSSVTSFSKVGANEAMLDSVTGQPPYTMANLDLSRRWIELVRDNQVAATVRIAIGGDDNDIAARVATEKKDTVAVRYGVRLVTRDSITRCEEFVVQEDEEQNDRQQHTVVQNINATLTSLQEQAASAALADASASTLGEDGSKPASTSAVVQYRMDGNFCAQLQLVRTLRPPPSPGFSGSATSIPPPYDSDTDSFVTGPLRLELRPLVATLQHPALTTPWDVFHNVSPADTRGHFLLIPTLSDATATTTTTASTRNSNCRGQVFTPNDCHDIIHLTSTIQPMGSLIVGFNSVGAGASQNHIHCHAWPSPPVPLQLAMEEGKDNEIGGFMEDGWNCYAVSKVKEIYDFCDLHDKSGEDDTSTAAVEISFLKYPVFCVQLSARTCHLQRLGQALATTLDSIGDAPFNIGFLNRPFEQYDYDDEDNNEDDNDDGAATEATDDSTVDVFVFVRSKERSTIFPSLKLGISEMMGVFHAQSHTELQTMVEEGTTSNLDVIIDQEEDEDEDDDHKHDEESRRNGPMKRALQEVSYQDEMGLWDTIKANFMG